ncbi:MAG TPA: hypothetical protein VF834_03565 [Streptosporangiaceae bacterium]
MIVVTLEVPDDHRERRDYGWVPDRLVVHQDDIVALHSSLALGQADDPADPQTIEPQTIERQTVVAVHDVEGGR